jgi:hypothetical protein
MKRKTTAQRNKRPTKRTKYATLVEPSFPGLPVELNDQIFSIWCNLERPLLLGRNVPSVLPDLGIRLVCKFWADGVLSAVVKNLWITHSGGYGLSSLTEYQEKITAMYTKEWKSNKRKTLNDLFKNPAQARERRTEGIAAIAGVLYARNEVAMVEKLAASIGWKTLDVARAVAYRYAHDRFDNTSDLYDTLCVSHKKQPFPYADLRNIMQEHRKFHDGPLKTDNGLEECVTSGSVACVLSNCFVSFALRGPFFQGKKLRLCASILFGSSKRRKHVSKNTSKAEQQKEHMLRSQKRSAIIVDQLARLAYFYPAASVGTALTEHALSPFLEFVVEYTPELVLHCIAALVRILPNPEFQDGVLRRALYACLEKGSATAIRLIVPSFVNVWSTNPNFAPQLWFYKYSASCHILWSSMYDCVTTLPASTATEFVRHNHRWFISAISGSFWCSPELEEALLKFSPYFDPHWLSPSDLVSSQQFTLEQAIDMRQASAQRVTQALATIRGNLNL